MIPIPMSGTFAEFEYKGHFFKSAFLQTDSLMSEEDRMNFRIQIADMYLDKKNKMKIKGEGYEGIISTENKYHMFGGFSGQQFDINLETNHGKSKLSLLVSKFINPEWN